MRLRLLTLVVAALALLAGATAAQAATYPAGFQSRTLISGLTGATGIAFAPDGRAFVIEKAGKLKVAQPGASTATQILDISNHVNDYGDRGLLGVAVDKDFASNGYVYLLYTYDVSPLTPDSSSPMVSRLVRIQIAANGTVANPAAPETVLLGNYVSGPCPQASNTLDCIPSDGSSHSIGSVRVAPDGTLYVGSGDAADFNIADPLSYRTYDEASFAGKILHVDRNGRGLPGHAFCPANANLDQVCTKLHAKGFRNPFRFTIRPNGGLMVGDVGWNTYEEVDLIDSAGGNYGWPCYEAAHRTPTHSATSQCAAEYAKEGTPSADTPPNWEYGRTLGSAVVGGPTYTGDQYPNGYRNSIFVGDYTGNFLKRLVVDGQDRVTSVQDFASNWIGTALELHPNGDLVSVNFGTGAPGDGFVERIVYTSGNGAPTAQLSANPTAGAAPLTVNFSAAGSSDPNGDTLSYAWDFGDGATATGATAQYTYTQPGSFTAKLTVSDGRGLDDVKTVQITPGGDAPTVSIQAPTTGFLYRDGDTIQLRGTATDAQDGTLSGSSLQWLVRLHHSTHIHPIATLSGTQTSFQALRDHDADSYYEVTLIAQDSSGLTASRSVEIRPQTIGLQLQSTPAGAPLSYGGRAYTAPSAITTTIGYDTTVSAAERFIANGRTYVFDDWSDNGARVHDVRVLDTPMTLRANYLEDLASSGTASASSSEGPGLEADKALDGLGTTRWSSSHSDDQWWQVDLGAAKQVSRVELDWEAAYASTYRILTSTDGTNFTQAAEVAIGGPGTKATTFAARSARYVRVQAVTRATQWGVSFYEARVLGPVDGGNPGDTTPPETTITAGPSGTTASATATFSFSSNESGSSFDCRLDGGAWARCTSPHDIAGLADGQHGFEVRAIDPAGNVDPTPATRSWTVSSSSTGENLALDRPASASSSEPAGLVPANAVDGDAATRWSSSYADGQWWQVDLGAAKQVSRVELDWEAAYASTYRILTSTDGTNFSTAADATATGPGTRATTFAARSTRYVRVLSLTRATQWGISFFEARVFGPSAGDTTPPDTTITAGPSGTVSSASASVEFSSNEQGSTFECRLDGGAWATCVSPRQLSGLADGSHTFEVRATDQAGNTDATPASRTWTVSTSSESQDLALGRPASASSSDAVGREADKAVDGNAATRWSSSFADGQWWQVDLGSTRQVSRVELDWETAYASSYEILVSTDGTNFTQAATVSATGPGLRSTSFSARSARYVRVRGLTRATQWGISFFSARVFGPVAGGADTTPPNTTITSGPSGTSASIAPSFAFSATEAGSSFECRLDGAAWASCTSPRALSNLGNGSHTFEVRATDQAGNTDATPASRTWTVNAAYDARVQATAGLANFWRLGETSGTSAADSKGTNTGAYTGGPTSVASLIAGNGNPARNFDGVDDYVNLAPGPFGTPAQVSAEAWVRIDQQKAAGGYHFLVTDAATDLSDGFTLAIDSAGRPVFTVANSATTRATAQSSLALTPNTTYHLVGTYDGQTVRVYVDGVQRGSGAYTGGIAYAAGRDLQLGRQVAATNRATRFLDGRLDEVAVYSTALSAATVAAHNAGGR